MLTATNQHATDVEAHDPLDTQERDRTYFESFLKPAHRYRWGTELVSIPRYKNSLHKANRDEEIDAGYKIGWMGRKLRLKRFDAYGFSNGKQTGTAFNAFRNSILRRDGSKAAKKWFFVTYPDDAYISVVQFDCDCHVRSGMTPWERDEVVQSFRMQVNSIREMADDVGLDLVWTTSPGDRVDATWDQETASWQGGAHVQGLYAWIKLEKPVQVKKLRRYVAALKDFYNIECESSVDAENRLVRLPGQRYVEVADPETGEVLHPPEKPSDTLAAFSEAWYAVKPVSPKTLFGPAMDWKKQKAMKPIATPKSLTFAPKNVVVHGCSNGQALKEANTFKAATDRRICSRLTIKYRGNEAFFDHAVEEAKNELVSIRPSSSRTCSSKRLLHSTCKRWMRWYFDNFESSSCRSSQFSKKESDDRQRFCSSRSLDFSLLLRFLKQHCHLSFRELSIVSAVLNKMRKWHGRVFCRVLYALSGGKSAWLALKKKLQGYLVILDEWQRKKCRQWGWSKKVLDSVSAMKQAQEDVAALLAGVEEELCVKRVVGEATSLTILSGTMRSQHLGVMPSSKQNECWDSDFREN
jgi:hypothetical protein